MPDDGEDAGKCCPLLEWCEMRDGQFRSIRDPLPKGRRGLRNVRLSLDSGRLAKIAACPRWAKTGKPSIAALCEFDRRGSTFKKRQGHAR
jgi:hypothetical protein